ncbi:hypothetical protein E6C67_08460 [Azospirillum sp. TSA2s]|uniref:phage tail length tape measure family protein n=1 Tax=Azospirillum sp. TSA2s TaxID=709810 RepID=UPI0010A9B0F0|nr:phage tail length tape measure family protein [Azospirillum sp. TSA2s]QCG93970.1 hypothetical protein E6C67_08460 [Azospirillum sp. TSA2s]
MATQRNEIVTILTVDARDLEAKAAASAAAVDKIGASLGKLAGAATTVETTLDASAKVSRRQAAELENLLRAIDPVYAAHAKLAAEQKRVEAAMTALDAQYRNGSRSAEAVATATNALTAKSKELAAIQSELSKGVLTADQAHSRISVTMGGVEAEAKRMTNALGLTKAQMQQLSPQINDVISGLMMGQAPMQIFTQQSGQIVQALQAGGAEMPKFRASTLAMAGAFGIAAAGAAVLVSRMVSISGEGRRLDETIRTLNPNLTATAQQLRQIAFDVADQQGVSRSDAMSALDVAIKNTRIQSAALLKDITELSVNISAVMGGEAADWAEKLSDAAKRGSSGFSELAAQLPGITADTLAAARAAEQHGDRMKALELIFGDLERRWGGASRAMKNDFSEALRGMWNAWDEFVERWAKDPRVAMGARIVAQMITWVTPETQDEARTKEMAGILEALDAKTAQLQQAVSRGQSGPGVDLLRKQVTELQAQYYGLAQAASVAAQATKDAQTAGSPAAGPSNDNKPNGLTETEQDRINRAREATERWAEAMRKTGAARQVAVAGVEAYNSAIERGATEEVAKAERAEAERRARISLSASIADNSAQLTVEARESLKVADAYMQSAAAGQAAEAMRQAQLDSLQSGVSVEQRYQEILNERAATQAATSAQALQTYQQEVAGREAVANATMEGVDAAYKAEMAEKVRIGTLAETIALENASGEAAEKLRKVIEAKTAAILDDERAQRKLQVAQAIQQQKDQLELGQAQLKLMGASAEQRAVEIARLQALVYLRNQHIDVMSVEGQAYIKNAENIARQSLETERLQAAYQELERFGDQAFSSVIDAVVKGGDATSTWKNAVKGLVTEFETLALKMAVLNPIKNAVFGSNLPTIFDFGSMGGGSAANQNGGGLLSNGNMLSLGSKLVPNSWTGGLMSSVDMWGAETLGIGSVAPGPTLSGAAGYVPAGTGLSSLLGAAGAGVGAGMLGGMLGTATNSKAVGGLTGAAGGAIASMALAGSIVPGIGTAIGAITGLISGLLSTQKATVGKTASADVTINAGGKSATYGNILTDNEGDPAAGKALGTALSGIFSIAAMGGGSLTKDFGIGQTAAKGLYVGGSVPYKEFGKGDGAIGDALRYMLLDQGGLKDGGVNTVKALKATKATDWEEAAKDIGLGASIDAGNTALREMVKTLSGVTDAAKKATTESFKPMFEELERAKKLGIDGAYKDLATDQLKAYLDQLRNPPDFTQVQTDMATLTGQFQAARDAYAQLNPSMVTYVDQIEKETRARIAANFNKSLDQQIAEASGRGYVNQINGFLETLDANTRSLAAVGEPAAKAQGLYNASLTSLLKTLTADQLGDVARSFGGDIATLATSMQQAAVATAAATSAQEEATRFQTLFNQIQRDNAQATITALNEQKSAATSLLSSWKNLQSSIAQTRQGLLVGDLSTLDPKSKMEQALADYRATLAKAQGGDVDAAGQVSGLAQTALQAARAYYASNQDYARIFSEVQDGLQGVESVASRQVSLASQQVSKLDQQLGVQQAILSAINKPAQTDVSAVLSGLNAGNLGDLVNWGKRMGSDTLYQVLSTADSKLGWQNNPYRYSSPSDLASVGNYMTMDDFSSVMRGIGFQGDISTANSWIAAYGKQSDYEAAIRSWAHGHGVPGFQNGGIVGNGVWGVDSVMAKLAGGEGVLTAPATAAIGPGAVDYINRYHALPANDRWGGNVVEYRPRASSQSSGGMADPETKALLREACAKLDTLIRVSMGAGDKNIEGLREVADGVSAVVKKVAGGDRR